ncbi:uncharacterized protein LOC114522656 [Dendronephthya gigantea]|uniref:uncharacterized protein LOC114522656 n=1 Tax=Dendronephthya gigantea TaxID=151771 RepID=UPI00106CEA7D|nr:uncharacterized protein LOC114522656 [Dendronephthya gigantea]
MLTKAGYVYNKTLVVITSILLISFMAIQLNHPMWFRHFRSDATLRRFCTPQDVQQDMLKLTYDIHIILRDLNITHFLMYGSLWGALRVNKPLPWDNDVDLGMIPDGKYPSLSEEQFLTKFREKGVKITNNMRQKSSFKFERGKGAVDLIIYYVYGGYMKRQGWEAWLMTIHYNFHHTFPRNLIEPKPLPKRTFGWFKMPVPRKGIEIMKHMYRYDWWETPKPERQC